MPNKPHDAIYGLGSKFISLVFQKPKKTSAGELYQLACYYFPIENIVGILKILRFLRHLYFLFAAIKHRELIVVLLLRGSVRRHLRLALGRKAILTSNRHEGRPTLQ